MVRTLVALLIAVSSAGCVIFVDEDSKRSSSSGSVSKPDPIPTATEPMLVRIDADRTMTATGGKGVGVFLEYRTGGHWHLWHTCDTLISGLACDMTTVIDAANASHVVGATLAGNEIKFSGSVKSDVAVVDFDTDPGAIITVRASISGVSENEGKYFFFVQDGEVRGGFSGQLTNPLKFASNSP